MVRSWQFTELRQLPVIQIPDGQVSETGAHLCFEMLLPPDLRRPEL